MNESLAYGQAISLISSIKALHFYGTMGGPTPFFGKASEWHSELETDTSRRHHLEVHNYPDTCGVNGGSNTNRRLPPGVLDDCYNV